MRIKLFPTHPLLLGLFIICSCILLLDSCVQFRMSSSELKSFYKDKSTRGKLFSYHIDKQKINYLHIGDSTLPLIVFVHGSPGSLSAFIDFTADTALLRRAQIVSVDRPGFGSSNYGYAEPSLKKQSSFLKPILQRFGKDKPVILVGHSLGGPVICRMAMDYPELVNSLVIVAGSIDPDLEPHEWFRGPLATPFLKWILPRSFRASNDEIYKLKPELQEMLPEYHKIRAATIVIQGMKDRLVAPDNAQFAKRMIVNAPVELVLVDDMDHFVPWSHPHLIRNALIKLLSAKSG